jgi:hypothetical protein
MVYKTPSILFDSYTNSDQFAPRALGQPLNMREIVEETYFVSHN